MAKENRMDEGTIDKMKGIAESHLNSELDQLDNLFDRKPLKDGEKNFANSAQRRANDIRAQLALVKDLFQWKAGAVHPAQANAKDEKALVAKMLQDTKDRIAKIGLQ